MADINTDGIPTPASPSLADTRSPDGRTGLSVSRRVKIGIVLLLMLCGYFLTEDRPRPAGFSSDSAGLPLSDETQMQAFIDDLDFVNGGEAPQRSSEHNQPEPLTLPTPVESTPASTPSVASSALIQPESFQNDQSTGHQPPVFPGVQHPRIQRESTESSDVLPVVKFTGRIEPLR